MFPLLKSATWAVKIPNPCFWMKNHIIMHACLRSAHECCVLDCKTCGNFDSGVCLRPSRRTHGSGTLFPDFFSLHGIFIFDIFFGLGDKNTPSSLDFNIFIVFGLHASVTSSGCHLIGSTPWSKLKRLWYPIELSC